jgi:hypothetical protein
VSAEPACCEATASAMARVKSLCAILRSVQFGGGQIVGFQPGPNCYLVLFCHPLSDTTLALPVSELTQERVTEKIVRAVEARFQFPTRPPQSIERISKAAITDSSICAPPSKKPSTGARSGLASSF